MSGNRDHVRRLALQDMRALSLLGVDVVPRQPLRVVRPGSRSDAPMIESLPVDLPRPDSVGKRTALDVLRREHDESCEVCRQMPGITQTVFGEGDPGARLMFIGEAPGEEEDRSGRPFVGRAGQKLDEIIKAMGLQRAGVYIANVLKSRPPGNRAPLPDEAEGCGPFLRRQIRIIHPTVIVAMGNPAMKFLLQVSEGITRMRGRWCMYADESLTIDVMPTFHPAYLLRNYTRQTREQMWSDMQAVLERLGRP